MCHFLIKMVLKKCIFDQKGGKNKNFEKSKEVPLDILEIHVVSKFGPIWMKIAAGSLSEPHTHGRTFQYPGTLLYLYCLPTRTQLSYLTRLTHNFYTQHQGFPQAISDGGSDFYFLTPHHGGSDGGSA